jgi:N-acetylmuramoyl-L-alanine amidase
VWNHPQNSTIRQARKDPNVLFPGDIVFIPEKDEKVAACATDKRHRFLRKGVPAMVRVVLVDWEGNPRSGESYVLEVDGRLITGVTGGDGKIEHRIPPNAQRGELRVGKERREVYALELGHTDPSSEISGIQCRLNNLGFDCGGIDGELGAATETALRAFQAKYGLPDTGEPDDATRNKLKEIHGS